MAIDPRNRNYICIGGGDEYARVFDMRTLSGNASNNIDPVHTFCPPHLSGFQDITGVACELLQGAYMSVPEEYGVGFFCST